MIDARDLARSLRYQTLAPATNPELRIESAEVGRPGLRLSGYWDGFPADRPQILGSSEFFYLESLPPEVRRERLMRLMGCGIPFALLCGGRAAEASALGIAEAAEAGGVPLYATPLRSTRATMELINFLNNRLAPRITRHGVLADVYGAGLFITGESGVGKSEAALELIKRGHRLVADDAVEIRRVTDNRLVGEAPEAVRNYMEIRGIGIVDVTALYGISAVIAQKSIDLVIHLEHWRKGAEYDRFGDEERTCEILGVRLPQLLLPIHPGRNLSIVLEVAARNLRLKQQGFNAAKELDRRLKERLRDSEGEE